MTKETSGWASTEWVLKLHVGLDHLTFRAMLALADCADAKGQAHPSMEWIAWRCEAPVPSVRDALRKAEALGVVAIERSTGRGRSNVYVLQIGRQFTRADKESWAEVRANEQAMDALRRGVNPRKLVAASGSDKGWVNPNSAPEKGKISFAKGEDELRKGEDDLPPPSYYPPREPHSDASHRSAARSQAGAGWFSSREEAMEMAADQRLAVIIRQDASTGLWGWGEGTEATTAAQEALAPPVDGMDVMAGGAEAPTPAAAFCTPQIHQAEASHADPVTSAVLTGRRASAAERIGSIQANIEFVRELQTPGWEAAVSRMEALIYELRREEQPHAGVTQQDQSISAAARVSTGQGEWRDRGMQPPGHRQTQTGTH